MTARQRRHAATMRARRGKRPWDEVNEQRAQESIMRLRKLFQMGKSDEFIANALNLDMYLVQILRNPHGRSRRR
jgi:hypothetical protein